MTSASRPPSSDIPVTVVMVTMNRKNETLNALSHLLELEEKFPVVVVDNGSGDGTAAAVRAAYPQVTVYEAGENLGAAGRNVGVRLANTPYVAFADDDSWWAPGSLRQGVEILEAHPKLGMIAAKILVGPENRLDPICTLMANGLAPSDGLPGVPITGFLACAAIARREDYLAVGGFRRPFGIGGEETIFAIDMWESGKAIHYVGDVVAHHWPSTVVSTRSGRRRREFRNDLWTTWLRRPWPVVARHKAKALRATWGDRDRLGGFLDAAQGLPWVIRDRRSISPATEAMLRRSKVASDAFEADELALVRQT